VRNSLANRDYDLNDDFSKFFWAGRSICVRLGVRNLTEKESLPLYVAKLSFPGGDSCDPGKVSHALHSFFGALRMNGQLLGQEYGISFANACYRVTVLLPDADALESCHSNRYVQRAADDLHAVGLSGPNITIVGKDIEASGPCRCGKTVSHILYTNYLVVDSPLRCGNCFHPIPLYKIPPTHHDDYYDIIFWQADYQACDTLQMNCKTLEHAATRELSRFDSSLSRRGIDICGRISANTGILTYYYLYRYEGQSSKKEFQRKCPSCGESWRLDKPWHELFDFKCQRCRLLSNIAPTLKPPKG
jgi:predicted  nucleic acid-binding Zn ribbon protein